RLTSQLRRFRFDGRLEGVGAFRFHLALVDLVAGGDEQRVEIGPAKDRTRGVSFWAGKDAINTTGLVADLDAHVRSHVQSSVAIHAQAPCPALVLLVGSM